MLVLGFMLPAFANDLQLTIGQCGSLVTWTMLGSVAGGLAFGALSDRLAQSEF